MKKKEIGLRGGCTSLAPAWICKCIMNLDLNWCVRLMQCKSMIKLSPQSRCQQLSLQKRSVCSLMSNLRYFKFVIHVWKSAQGRVSGQVGSACQGGGLPRGCLPGGMSAQGVCTPPHPVDRMADTCKIITSFADGKNISTDVKINSYTERLAAPLLNSTYLLYVCSSVYVF